MTARFSASAASRGPSCGRAWLPFCRKDAARRSCARLSQASASAPMMFSITASAWRAGSPSGQPATARICCSNWEQAQASMVQWPELCTRGAISLTSSAPSFAQTVPPPARRHNPAPRRFFARWLWPRRFAPWSGGPARWSGAGCDFRGYSPADRRRRKLPSAPRAAITEASKAKSTKPSRMQGAPLKPPMALRRFIGAGRLLPGPCRHSQGGGS